MKNRPLHAPVTLSAFGRPLWAGLAVCACLALAAPASAQAPGQSVYMEELTWKEIDSKLRTGLQIVIVPTGGLEQGGPHLVTGKQNIIARHASGQIALAVGGLAAPVISYVPEGRVEPPEGHMQFPGTISISEQTFAALLEDTARSLKQHGFKYIFFIGEHSGSQRAQQQVADRLSAAWYGQGVRVVNVAAYFQRHAQEEWGEATGGVRVRSPDAHAGHIETSEMMALDPGGVRDNLRAAYTESDFQATGAVGDSTRASAKFGRRYIGLKQQAAIQQIKRVVSMQDDDDNLQQ